MRPTKILFVCVGNTCRSPMAESIMSYWVKEYGLNWRVDSAALKPWNIGRRPDERCLMVLDENGLSTEHVCKMIDWQDFYEYDFILAMDFHNLRVLQQMAKRLPNYTAKIDLLGVYLDRPEDETIRDPYFSLGVGSFRSAFVVITEACQKFIVLYKPKNKMLKPKFIKLWK